jgi:hypothetical protein
MGDDDDDDLCERSRSLMCDKIGQLWDNPDCVDNIYHRLQPGKQV